MNDTVATLEALLFAAGDPLSNDKIAELMHLNLTDVDNLLIELDNELSTHGIILREVAGGWQLSTRPKYFHVIERLAQTVPTKLSSSAMDTLSIIAFNQPITRLEIEQIRGINSDRSINKLIELDLIEEVGKKDVIGYPSLFSVTQNFLRVFGLKTLKDLPKIST